MVYRVYTEKKPELANEARNLKKDLVSLFHIKGLENLRILNRYDVENITPERFAAAVEQVFSEPQIDLVTESIPAKPGDTVFAVEYLPGQFDQRADSAAQCMQLLFSCERPAVRTARVYVLSGALSPEDTARVKKYVINPVESREASLEEAETLAQKCVLPETVAVLDGFCALDRAGLDAFVEKYGLAMDRDDAAFCQQYFRGEKREPTITEIRMLDTYWSDHCRHTTFLTTLDHVRFEDAAAEKTWQDYLATREELHRKKPVNLMDLATLAVKYLKKTGQLDKLDESEEINACTVKIRVEEDGVSVPWLLLFKNETHNHPTEIEPFGGAATCIGGAIRDPLSGRSYVYAAMRLTGAADPTRPVEETVPGRLPQRKIVTGAANGYSSYGNQIGLATGIVDELYHDGYVAKHMELGAVIGAVRQENVRREAPCKGDVVILLGGKTGRDGCGGATGSSKSHTASSLEKSGAEVQKGNAPEERKLQRLFRDKATARTIKRCNDFGAGGVSVAVGELADGLEIDLDAVPRKYDGLDGTELAISESQERMAVVVAPGDADAFLAKAAQENLEATPIAVVTDDNRLKMRWKGNWIVDISREFLSSNGAEKHTDVLVPKGQDYRRPACALPLKETLLATVTDPNGWSRRGLSQNFDSTVGAGTVLMPFGGQRQKTPVQAMVHKIPLEHGTTDDCSFMAWGYNPYVTEKSPYHGAYLAVVESVSRLIATGASFRDVYLTFQEFFARPGHDAARWGQPLAALLGAFRAQKDYGIGAIGGKDSMSGTFEKLDVPPTLVSFAVTVGKTGQAVSNHFKKPGHRVMLLEPAYSEELLPVPESQKALFDTVTELLHTGRAAAAYTPGYGGLAEAVFKMCLGGGLGFRFTGGQDLRAYRYGSFLLEMTDDDPVPGEEVGVICREPVFLRGDERVDAAAVEEEYEQRPESVYSCNIPQGTETYPAFSYKEGFRKTADHAIAVPTFLIPVFPGTNCEYDTARAIEKAGGRAEIFVVRNLSAADVASSVNAFACAVARAQAIVLPGGFSGGDEPDGSGKFITAFLRNERIRDGVQELLRQRDGLMLGVCNGFQALIKLGLVPYGEILAPDKAHPTLAANTIGHHQSMLVRTRVCSDKSPWLMHTSVGEIYTVPVSHGEGRFLADEKTVRALAENGQIATQYVNLRGVPTRDIRFNPNDSVYAIEGITSPDGRVLGKMGHSERIGEGLYQNVDGLYDMHLFSSAVTYFK